MYQAQVAGKSRLDGARSALEALGVPEADKRAADYAERKQARLEQLIHAGAVAAFPDALRMVQALAALGMPMAVTSSSKNANQMMRPIRLAGGASLLGAFGANVCGRDLPHGKPDPEIFLVAARELGFDPACCFVAEDAPVGVQAARAAGMAALGVARLDDAAPLRAAGADPVVTSLDELDVESLAAGRLRRRPA
jgi:HAD superfamily hydrolase (TIGR01509 family)